MSNGQLRLSSSAFKDGASIPVKYTCKGDNVSPAFRIDGVPEKTLSLALIMHDPDAPSGDFLHWTVWNINPATSQITENSLPAGAVQGLTDFGQASYGGPCPPSGTHHYHFDLYTLDTQLGLKSGATVAELRQHMQNHILVKTTLIGLFSK
ncbi:YbhB/YbcL family Raf kinase inhibitor-like protein [Candidatus Saccharibacteria bacterium]|nr:YbhB/YbcL family Raf kinase inhibitor-like protein [Candidatus Saccharibacteria bacterium]